jgi:hypothetical protein
MKVLKTFLMIVPFLSVSTIAWAGEATGTVSKTADPGSSIRDSAGDTSSSNKNGQLINMAMGGINLYNGYKNLSQCEDCHSCCVIGAVYVAMGLMNMAQSKADGKTAGQAMGTFGATDTNMGGGYDPNAVNTLSKDPEIKQGIEFGNSLASTSNPSNLASWDPKTNTLTTASGHTVKASDLNSPAAMAAAGISPAMISDIMSTEKKIEESALKKVEKLGLNKTAVASTSSDDGFGGGGGGGGGGGSMKPGSGGSDLHGYGGGAASGPKLGIDRDPAQVAGMQKNYNGEPIGVAGDSIFRMMTRRYKVKESQSTFLDDAALIQK